MCCFILLYVPLIKDNRIYKKWLLKNMLQVIAIDILVLLSIALLDSSRHHYLLSGTYLWHRNIFTFISLLGLLLSNIYVERRRKYGRIVSFPTQLIRSYIKKQETCKSFYFVCHNVISSKLEHISSYNSTWFSYWTGKSPNTSQSSSISQVATVNFKILKGIK